MIIKLEGSEILPPIPCQLALQALKLEIIIEFTSEAMHAAFTLLVLFMSVCSCICVTECIRLICVCVNIFNLIFFSFFLSLSHLILLVHRFGISPIFCFNFYQLFSALFLLLFHCYAQRFSICQQFWYGSSGLCHIPFASFAFYIRPISFDSTTV